MYINHESRISGIQRELIRRGYGEERLNNLTFRFEYTEEQKAANIGFANMVGSNSSAWNERCKQSARQRSEHMFPVMEALAAQFVCYQYAKEEKVAYSSPDWDLFFWCKSLDDSAPAHLADRDFSYFRLSFNDCHSQEKQEAIYTKVLKVLENFHADENLSVTVLRTAKLYDDKIAAAAQAATPSLVGKCVRYQPTGTWIGAACEPMEGRVVELSGRLCFMKKRARSRGYILSDQDILKMAWDQEKTSLQSPSFNQ